jgi:hypothetical protein
MKDDDRYIYTLITEEMLEDPDVPGIPPLEAMGRRMERDFFNSGLPGYRSELRPGVEPIYKVNFIPRRGEMPIMQQVPEKNCEACGTPLDARGRCRGCWADVMGICENCGALFEEEGGPCVVCGPL